MSESIPLSTYLIATLILVGMTTGCVVFMNEMGEQYFFDSR